MEVRDSTDKPKITNQDSIDKIELQRKLQDALEARSGTFRCSDMELGGEVRTSVERQGSLHPRAKAEVFRPDGTRELVGWTHYRVAGDEARIYPDNFNARTYPVEGALLDEVSQSARAQGANHLRVWVRDDDPAAAPRWLRRGFQPTERNPGAPGVDWEKPL